VDFQWLFVDGCTHFFAILGERASAPDFGVGEVLFESRCANGECGGDIACGISFLLIGRAISILQVNKSL
jgi:hypothetical protein